MGLRSRLWTYSSFLAAWVILTCVAAVGQSEFGRPSFEVASIKPTPPERQNQLRMDFCGTGGRFVVGGTPVFWSLKYAFGLKDYQIVGVPGWLTAFDSAYDIEAKPARPVDNAECRLMLQSLFADRFKLAVHHEMNQSTVYLLKIGKKGPKLPQGGGVKLNESVQMAAPGRPEWPNGWTMPRLAEHLSDVTGRPVVDRTGLDGTYGITLKYSRSDSDDNPSIFTAVQEQLGLKLEPGRAPVDVLVIDHIEKPSAN
jgi:bla regulator protein blaR1